MKSKIILGAAIIALCVSCSKSNKPPAPVPLSPVPWAKTFGGTQLDELSGVLATQDGGYIMAGTTSSNDVDVSGNKGKDDIWVVKLNAARDIIWQKTFGGSMYEQANAIALTPDGGYIVAGSSTSADGDITGGNKGLSDIWVLKLNSTGGIVWQKSFGGTFQEHANKLLVTANGDCIVLGETSSSDGDVVQDPNSEWGSWDIWLLKLDGMNGNILLNKTMGGTESDIATSIISLTSGGYYIGGSTASSDGIFSGVRNGSDCFIVKLNQNLEFQEAKTFGGNQSDYANEMIATKDGGYIAIGNSNSTDIPQNPSKLSIDAYVVKLNSNGVVVWQRILGGTRPDEGFSIVQKTNGNYIMAASTRSNFTGDVPPIKGSRNLWLVELDNSGNIVGPSKTLGGEVEDKPAKVLIDADGGYVVGGSTLSTKGDIGTLRGGKTDMFLLKVFDLQ